LEAAVPAVPAGVVVVPPTPAAPIPSSSSAAAAAPLVPATAAGKAVDFCWVARRVGEGAVGCATLAADVDVGEAGDAETPSPPLPSAAAAAAGASALPLLLCRGMAATGDDCFMGAACRGGSFGIAPTRGSAAPVAAGVEVSPPEPPDDILERRV
jgi:hypothetical protein